MRRKTSKFGRIVISIIMLTPVMGCGPKDHLHPEYGGQSRLYFARQRLHQEAASGTPRGLDSEEAALIHASYREQLGADPKDNGSKAPSHVLLVQPKQGHAK